MLMAIATHADGAQRRCWCGPECLAEELNGHVRTIQRAIASLVAHGAIARMRAKGGARGEWWYVPVLVDADLIDVETDEAKGAQRARRRHRAVNRIVDDTQPDLLNGLEVGASCVTEPDRLTATLAADPSRSTATLAADRQSSLYTGFNVDSNNEEGATAPTQSQLFTPEEQGARVVINGSAFKWVDPKGQQQKLGYHFVEGLMPGEPSELVRAFVASKLQEAMDRNMPGSLHGWVRSALHRGFAAWKRDRLAAMQGTDAGPPIGAELPTLADQGAVWES